MGAFFPPWSIVAASCYGCKSLTDCPFRAMYWFFSARANSSRSWGEIKPTNLSSISSFLVAVPALNF